MRPIGSPWLAVASLIVLAHPLAGASSKPRSGGTLRVELQAAALSIDPREWKPGSLEFAVNEKLAALVFDRLVALDNFGQFQPRLAAEWSHDAAFKRWQFTLRAGVKFSDGERLTAAHVVAALEPLLPNGQQITPSGNSVVIQCSEAMPDLLGELASGRFFVYRVHSDGSLLGTGPFLEDSAAGPSKAPASTAEHSKNAPSRTGVRLPLVRFRAKEGAWSGRPFVDSIEITLGVPALRQLFDLQLGKADVVEIAPDLVRRATQENQRVWFTAPVTLYGLAFSGAQAERGDSEAKLREAISLSLDRHTMANVLLQRQAEPAVALLPQWLSGYAFLFNMETNLERAKEIRSTLPTNAVIREPLRLRVDAPGDLAKLLGERVAVNVRQAAISVQLQNRSPLPTSPGTTVRSSDSAAWLRLFAWHYSSLSPRVELETFVSALNLESPSEGSNARVDLEHVYARERKLLDERRVVPLVVLPEYVGLGRNVRDWMPSKWGEWYLADVWLDLSESAPAGTANRERATAALPTIRLGAKP